MGRTSSGVRAAGGLDRDTNYTGNITEVESLINMKDADMYRAAKQAISNFSAKLGVPEREVKLADLSKGVMGVGRQGGVYLNKKYYNRSISEFRKIMDRAYDTQHLTRTNKPVAHTITHELAHASWTSDLETPKARAAGVEIRRLYNSFKRNKPAGYGTYAYSNIDEFWAEASTRAAHGTADSITRRIRAIYRKYNL